MVFKKNRITIIPVFLNSLIYEPFQKIVIVIEKRLNIKISHNLVKYKIGRLIFSNGKKLKYVQKETRLTVNNK